MHESVLALFPSLSVGRFVWYDLSSHHEIVPKNCTSPKGMTICHPNEFVQSHILDGFLIKYLYMIYIIKMSAVW